MLLLIKNGTVINPGDQTQVEADVLVEDWRSPASKGGTCH